MPQHLPAASRDDSVFGFLIEHPNRDEACVRLRGDVGLAASDRLAGCLDHALTRCRRITIDLQRVTFMDCTGVSVLLDAHIRAQLDGNQVMLIRGPLQIDRLLAATGLERAFRFTDQNAGPLDGAGSSAPTAVQRSPLRTDGDLERFSQAFSAARDALSSGGRVEKLSRHCDDTTAIKNAASQMTRPVGARPNSRRHAG